MHPDEADEIRRLNDLLRQTGEGGIVYVDRAIYAKGGDGSFYQAVFQAVMECNDFGPDIFRHHDFGRARVQGHRVQWSIEYRSTDLFEERSNNPVNPSETIRVLQIRLVQGDEDDSQ